MNEMMASRFFLYAALNGFVVVALGAFGAHGLENVLSPARLETWQTGVQYQMFHVVGLLAVALLCQQHKANKYFLRSGYLFQLGIVLFSGSLYLLSLSGLRWLGLLTPLGGLAWLAAWLLLAYGIWQIPGKKED